MMKKYNFSKQNYLFDISVKNVLTNKAMILLTAYCLLITVSLSLKVTILKWSSVKGL